MSSVLEGGRDYWEKSRAEAEAARHATPSVPSTTGDGGGTYGGMNDRLTALETHFEYVRRDLDDLKVGQADIHRVLSDVATGVAKVGSDVSTSQSSIEAKLAAQRAELATKDDIRTWKLQWTAIGAAVIAIVIGGIIGGLGWIQALGTAPAP